MPQRDNERNVVEYGQAKAYQICSRDDPEPILELESGRAHDRICSEASAPLQSAIAWSVGRNNKPIAFAVLEHRVSAPRLFLWRPFKFNAALLQLGIRLLDVLAGVRHVHERPDSLFVAVGCE